MADETLAGNLVMEDANIRLQEAEKYKVKLLKTQKEHIKEIDEKKLEVSSGWVHAHSKYVF